MHTSVALATLALAGLTAAQEQVLGVYIFSRHGDRTAKSTPPANLTDLGYAQVYESGNYYRDRYVNGTNRIFGMNPDLVKQSQIAVSAPADTVLQNSAQGFLQALYPPVGPELGSATLRNGTVVRAPMNGYQLIPVAEVESGANSENSAWLQGASDCMNAENSSKNFTESAEYLSKLNSSMALYQRIHPTVENTFNESSTSFKNAYTIWDLLNVASIHNDSATTPLPSPADFAELQLLAFEHEFDLAYNASEPIRAVTGSIMAGQVVTALNTTIASKGKSKLNIQFGAYAGMQSFFGLADLTSKASDFYGVPDYASTLVWELVTNASVSSSSWPAASDISVRFLYRNGSASESTPPIEYPLFGSDVSPMPWNDFVTGMNAFAISDQHSWCQACGNSTGVCDPSLFSSSSSPSPSTSSSDNSSSGGGISKAVAGVIGAMVTLGVILGAEALILLLGGLTISKRRRGQQGQTLAGKQSPTSSISAGGEDSKAHA